MIIQERWIPGYENHYKVSVYGHIISFKGKGVKFLTPRTDDKNRFRVALTLNGKQKQYSVSRLVAMTFFSNYNENKKVIHADKNVKNNAVSNLRLVDTIGKLTVKRNYNKRGCKKIPVIMCNSSGEPLADFESIAQACRYLQCGRDIVKLALDNPNRTARGHKFLYKGVK